MMSADTWFSLLNFSSAAAVSVWLLMIYARRRHLLVKPSMQVLVAMHVLLHWPLAIRSDVVFDFLAQPMHAWLLMNAFMIIALFFSERSGVESAEEIFSRIGRDTALRESGVRRGHYLAWLVAGVGAATLIYLSQVQLSRLGLVVAFLDPASAQVAREESLKLIDSAVVRYAFSVLTAVLVPMASVMAAFGVHRNLKHRKPFVASLYIGAILVFLVIVSLTGARYFAAITVLTVVLGFVFRRRLRVRPARLIVLGALVILPAVLLTMLRQGELGALTELPTFFLEFVGHRIFSAPTDVSIWYMHFAQTYGPFGVGAIPKLAAALGEPEIYSQNVIGARYTLTSLPASVHANGSFLFSYYGYFGLWAVPTCIALVLSLDFFLPLLRRTHDDLLVPTLAAMAAAALSFAQSDFTPVLISHGYAVVPVVAIALGLWVSFWHSDRRTAGRRAEAGFIAVPAERT